jgi:hypothetical protein
MCRILSTAKPFELLASKIAQFPENFHFVVIRVESLAGSRVRFLGRWKQCPSSTFNPLRGYNSRSAFRKDCLTSALGPPIRRSSGAAYLWLRLRRTVIFELKATITWQKARLPEWHEGCLQPRKPL